MLGSENIKWKKKGDFLWGVCMTAIPENVEDWGKELTTCIY